MVAALSTKWCANPQFYILWFSTRKWVQKMPIMPGGPVEPVPIIFPEKEKKRSTPTPSPTEHRPVVRGGSTQPSSKLGFVPRMESDNAVYWLRPGPENDVFGINDDELLNVADVVFCLSDNPAKDLESFKERYNSAYELSKKYGVDVWFREGEILVATKKRGADAREAALLTLEVLLEGGVLVLTKNYLSRRAFVKGLVSFGFSLYLGKHILDKMSELYGIYSKKNVHFLPLPYNIPTLKLAFTLAVLEVGVKIRFKDKKPKDGKKPQICLLLGNESNDMTARILPNRFGTNPYPDFTGVLKEYKKTLDNELKLDLTEAGTDLGSKEAKQRFKSYYVHVVRRYEFSRTTSLDKDRWDEEKTEIDVLGGL